MKIITLTKGMIAKVDDEDYEWLSKFSWYAHKERNKYYAVRKSKRSGGKQKMIYMHREILRSSVSMKCDHIDGDGLNNQKENLRVCTNQQNLMNRGPQQNNTTGYKGVSKTGARYYASINTNGSNIYLGSYEKPEDAAKAYDKKAKELFGDFAYQNFP